MGHIVFVEFSIILHESAPSRGAILPSAKGVPPIRKVYPIAKGGMQSRKGGPQSACGGFQAGRTTDQSGAHLGGWRS